MKKQLIILGIMIILCMNFILAVDSITIEEKFVNDKYNELMDTYKEEKKDWLNEFSMMINYAEEKMKFFFYSFILALAGINFLIIGLTSYLRTRKEREILISIDEKLDRLLKYNLEKLEDKDGRHK